MKTKRTTKVDENYWLCFFENEKEVAGFGITKDSRVKYNRLRELWNHGNITLKQLQTKIAKICS